MCGRRWVDRSVSRARLALGRAPAARAPVTDAKLVPSVRCATRPRDAPGGLGPRVALSTQTAIKDDCVLDEEIGPRLESTAAAPADSPWPGYFPRRHIWHDFLGTRWRDGIADA